ncbi:MAG TPA: MarR family transcriptional regulator [Longimicrobium sp.]|jgi:MarR family 2-MHQ and catechol resistance regulon transcriptional repressor|uniref:MarR family winged helix-turn-helix transcriptional regulator n=1 Tax=Longimicrobium sp. TaxID=2029185 RepID=UPI002EDAD005
MDAETSAALKLWVVAHRALHTVQRRLARHTAEHGLTPTEFGVLEVMYSKGPTPLGEIASKVLMQCGSLTYVIKKLEEQGYVVRRPSDEDRRVIFGELTEQGRALMDILFPAHARIIRDAMAGAAPEEIIAATGLLKQIGGGGDLTPRASAKFGPRASGSAV